MDFTYLKNVLVYLVSALISVFIIVYIILQMSGSFSDGVETTLAMMDTQQEMLTLDGYIIRTEQVLYAIGEGSVNYLFDDGDRVGAGVRVAELYSSDSIQEEVIRLDRKIDMLESSNLAASSATSDLNTLDGRINSLYSTILGKMESGNLRYALEKAGDLQIQLNRRQIVVKTIGSFTDRINALTRQREAYSSSLANLSEIVTSTSAGYFFRSLDGYEDAYSAIDPNLLTITEFNRLIQSEPADLTRAAQGTPIGKVVTEFTWYIACKVPYSTVHNYVENGNYTLRFPYNGDTKITVNLYRTITEANQNEVILLFRTSSAPENFDYQRRQTVEIIMSSYSGYKVPISALRMVDGKTGVFILKGSVAYFREVEPLFEKNGYMIVEEKDISNPDHLNRLGLYEMIITQGKDYYDGQIIN